MKFGSYIFLLLFAQLLATPSFTQSPQETSTFTITIKDGRYFVAGVVNTEETKEKVLRIIRDSVGILIEGENIAVKISADKFPNGWEAIVAKELLPVKTWKSGVYTYARDLEADKRALLAYLATAEVNEPGKLGTSRLLDTTKSVTIINLFAVWNGPSRVDLPLIGELYKKYSSNGLNAVAVNVDEVETADEIARFKQTLSLEFKFASFNKELVERMLNVSRFNAIPQTFVIRDGKIEGIYRGAGPAENKKLKELVESIFAQ